MKKLVAKVTADKASVLDERHLAELLEIMRAITAEAEAVGDGRVSVSDDAGNGADGVTG